LTVSKGSTSMHVQSEKIPESVLKVLWH